MDALRQLSSPTAIVIRDGHPVVIPSKQVVPGDVVQIKAGDVIPADVSISYSAMITTDHTLDSSICRF